MTEQEWLEGTDPKPMLEFLHGTVMEESISRKGGELFALEFLRVFAPLREWIERE